MLRDCFSVPFLLLLVLLLLSCSTYKPCPLQVRRSTDIAHKLICMTALKLITSSEMVKIHFGIVDCSGRLIIVYCFLVSYSIWILRCSFLLITVFTFKMYFCDNKLQI